LAEKYLYVLAHYWLTIDSWARLLVLFGAIWFLQDINILPGSFMTGQIRWTIFGGIAPAAVALFVRGQPKKAGWRALKPRPRLHRAQICWAAHLRLASFSSLLVWDKNTKIQSV
jgi:hypothetical protein